MAPFRNRRSWCCEACAGDAKGLADLVRTNRHNHREVAGDSEGGGRPPRAAARVGTLRHQGAGAAPPAGSGVEARRLQPVSVSRSALVPVEGAWYSVPERWTGLSVIASVGV